MVQISRRFAHHFMLALIALIACVNFLIDLCLKNSTAINSTAINSTAINSTAINATLLFAPTHIYIHSAFYIANQTSMFVLPCPNDAAFFFVRFLAFAENLHSFGCLCLLKSALWAQFRYASAVAYAIRVCRNKHAYFEKRMLICAGGRRFCSIVHLMRSTPQIRRRRQRA